ncbi:unnamed protein product [Calicophoron daubneyi]|uniref:Uncharacterized protein n=1 Tax=Calicophoron daubneyi TaxID=300641 RepID=A0AAV2TKJ0_CALDB
MKAAWSFILLVMFTATSRVSVSANYYDDEPDYSECHRQRSSCTYHCNYIDNQPDACLELCMDQMKKCVHDVESGARDDDLMIL